jgi:hypothetical protein
MTEHDIIQVIESSTALLRDINRTYSCAMINLNNPESQQLYGSQFIEYFLNQEYVVGSLSDKYTWNIKRADSIINLRIFKA